MFWLGWCFGRHSQVLDPDAEEDGAADDLDDGVPGSANIITMIKPQIPKLVTAKLKARQTTDGFTSLAFPTSIK